MQKSFRERINKNHNKLMLMIGASLNGSALHSTSLICSWECWLCVALSRSKTKRKKITATIAKKKLYNRLKDRQCSKCKYRFDFSANFRIAIFSYCLHWVNRTLITHSYTRHNNVERGDKHKNTNHINNK